MEIRKVTEVNTAYKCPKCGERWDSEWNAQTCCPLRPIFLCNNPQCASKQEHDTAGQAVSCAAERA